MPSTNLYKGLQKSKFSNAEMSAAMDVLQNQIDNYFRLICSKPILDGILIEGILTTAVSDTDIVISHKLGRAPQGFIMTDSNANIILYRSPTPARIPDTQIVLRAVFPVAAVHKFACWFF